MNHSLKGEDVVELYVDKNAEKVCLDTCGNYSETKQVILKIQIILNYKNHVFAIAFLELVANYFIIHIIDSNLLTLSSFRLLVISMI